MAGIWKRPDDAYQIDIPGAAMRSRLGPRPKHVSTDTSQENHIRILRIPQPQELLVFQCLHPCRTRCARTLLTQPSRERLKF